MMRLLLGVAIVALRLAHIWCMRRYRRTFVDDWRKAGLALAFTETRVRIERDRLVR